MGLNKDLELKGNEFSNAATVFFAAYLISEIPTGEYFLSHNARFLLTWGLLHSVHLDQSPGR
jgi:hypothetical protein